jgi:hypothetical protein
MLSSVTLENDHPCGMSPQLDPSAVGRRVASCATPTAQLNDGPDRSRRPYLLSFAERAEAIAEAFEEHLSGAQKGSAELTQVVEELE